MNLHYFLKELRKLPNQLTLLRIVLTFFLYAQLYFYQHMVFVATFIVAGLTDFFDGYFARKLKMASAFGSLLDTIADNFLHYSIFFFILVLYPEVFFTYLTFIIVLLGLVLTYSAVCVIKHKKYFGLHTAHNKINSFLLILFFLTLLLMGFNELFFYLLTFSVVVAYIMNIYFLLSNERIELK